MDDFRIKVGYLFDEASAKAGAKKARGLFGDVVKDFRSQLGLQLGRGIAQATIRGVKDMVDNVKELDKAQTELKKVTELSGKSLDTFTNKAYEAGKKTARTGTEMVQAST